MKKGNGKEQKEKWMKGGMKKEMKYPSDYSVKKCITECVNQGNGEEEKKERKREHKDGEESGGKIYMIQGLITKGNGEEVGPGAEANWQAEKAERKTECSIMKVEWREE